MYKTELIDSMCETGGMSRKYAMTAVDAMLKTIKDALRRGENVTIPGFGTFMVKNKPERQGRNPQTGETMIVPARKVPAFKPGSTLKSAVAGSTFKDVAANGRDQKGII